MDNFPGKRKYSPRKKDVFPLETGHVSERIPPHNRDAEQGLLASCILEGGGRVLNDCLAAKVTPAYFFTAPHQLIFEAIVKLNFSGTGIDEITLCESLRSAGTLEAIGGPTYINELTNRIEVTTHAAHWLGIVREKYFLRQLISTATRTVEIAFNPTGDLDHLLDSVEKSFFEISQDRITDSAQHVGADGGTVDQAMAMFNTMVNGKGVIHGISTGFPELDKMCFGFHAGQMIVVAARPGMGKTSIALNFIEGALFTKGKRPPAPTLMFSLEMPSRDLVMRLLSARAGLNMQRLRDGFVEKGKMPEVVEAADEYKKMPLFIDDAGGQTILEIRAKARRWVQQQKITEQSSGLIVIDYLQLINGTDSSVSREQQIAEASRSIKAMAKEFNIPIVALAQLNRKNEDEQRAPRVSDLRESGSIEQDADMVLLIDRVRGRKVAKPKPGERAEEEPEEERAPGIFKRKLIIAKQRNGPIGEIDLDFHSALTKFMTPADSHFKVGA